MPEFESESDPQLMEYKIVRKTPKGIVIQLNHPFKERWVSNAGKKRFAHPTKEEALDSYIKRKEVQIRILKDRLQFSKECLANSEKMKER